MKLHNPKHAYSLKIVYTRICNLTKRAKLTKPHF